MHGSRNFCQAGGGEGGDGVEARRPEKSFSLDNVFLVINLFYSLQSGSNGFITKGRRGSNFLFKIKETGHINSGHELS